MSLTPPLKHEIIARCSTTKARVSRLTLPHNQVDLPTFMAVGTQGTMKGLTPDQLKEIGCQIILGNTYHLGHRPGPELLIKAGGLHEFMRWDKALLTDSGGFQMVSLLKLARITEEGVQFQSPHDNSLMMLTPEHSMELQNAIGADIMMQLDDVIATTTTGERVEEAMHRSIRWLDRCIKAHKRPNEQNLFPIIQGGLDPELRRYCIQEMVKRDMPGYAIGGLSGGESKDDFWKVVTLCTDLLPDNKPRYCMGVGYAEDLVVCSALGVDMYDCVFPTRTARFGNALTFSGSLSLKQHRYANDSSPIDPNCPCSTCKSYSRSFLHSIVTRETVGCHLVSIHNLTFQMTLMKRIRDSIIEDKFPEFVREFMKGYYKEAGEYPNWVVEALESVGVKLDKLD